MIFPKKFEFKIETGREKHEVLALLDKKVVTHRSFNPFSLPWNTFVGEVYSTGFHIRHAVWYSRSLIPVFHGSFEEAEKGVVVKIRAFNGVATINALACWIGTVIEIVASFINFFHADYSSAIVLFLVSVVSGVAATFIGWLYNKKMNDGRNELLDLFERAIER